MLPEDSDRFAIPACDLLADQLIECGWNDPEFDDPSAWLSWTDADRFEPGRALTPVETVPDILPGEEDLAEHQQWCIQSEDLGHGGFGHHGCECEWIDNLPVD